MSHVPGADVESQEISTVADMVNFETKRIMYRRFTVGFGCFVLAQLCECAVALLLLLVVVGCVCWLHVSTHIDASGLVHAPGRSGSCAPPAPLPPQRTR
jgi:hypothetical protein